MSANTPRVLRIMSADLKNAEKMTVCHTYLLIGFRAAPDCCVACLFYFVS